MEGKTQQTAAAMAGMSERSARKWEYGPLPSETKQERWWRTRTDPFEGVWEEEILPLLKGEAAGKLRATTIIEWLEDKHPGRFSASQVRTLQRRLQDYGSLDQKSAGAGDRCSDGGAARRGFGGRPGDLWCDHHAQVAEGRSG